MEYSFRCVNCLSRSSSFYTLFYGCPERLAFFVCISQSKVFYDQTTSFFMGNSVYSYWDYGQHYKFDITYTDNMGNKTDLSLSVLFLQLCHFYD